MKNATQPDAVQANVYRRLQEAAVLVEQERTDLVRMRDSMVAALASINAGISRCDRVIRSIGLAPAAPKAKKTTMKARGQHKVSEKTIHEVFAWLRDHPGEHTVMQVSEGVGRTRSVVQAALKALRERGSVRLAGTIKGGPRGTFVYTADWPTGAALDEELAEQARQAEAAHAAS